VRLRDEFFDLTWKHLTAGQRSRLDTDQDLRIPPSNRFEKLRGKLADFHSIRVNKHWRLIFKWDGNRGEAADVYLDDHGYK
jgi:toxin HigB-1